MGRKKDTKKWDDVAYFLLNGAADRSDRFIVELLRGIGVSCSPTFVGKVRKEQERQGKLQPGGRTGMDDRIRGGPPKEKPPPKKRGRRPGQKAWRREFQEGSPAWIDQQLRMGVQILAEELVESHSVEALPLTSDPVDPKSARQGGGRRVNHKPKKKDEE